jgi:hypothetical protein
MHRPALSDNQILLMLELCLDGETRCHERIEKARDRGDYRSAAYEVQLKEQYEDLKHRLFSEMRNSTTSTHDLHETLRKFALDIERLEPGPFSGLGNVA